MQTRYSGGTFAFALLLWTAAILPATASPWAEAGDSQLRNDIELLTTSGVIDEITIAWPLPWASLLHGLRGKDFSRQPSAVRAAAQRVLAKAQAGTAAGFSGEFTLDATNRPSVVYGFDGLGRGDAQSQISLGASAGVFSARLSLGAMTQNFGSKPNKLMLDGTYVSARLGGVLVYAGYLDHWWGPGQISALQLSNNARPMPQVGIERSSTSASSWPVLRWLGPWQAEVLFGYLDGPRIQPDTYYSAARLTIHPLKGFELAIARTEEFCGQGHSCVPLRDYFQFSNNPLSINNTNDELAFDFKYSNVVGRLPYQVYVQLMNEDYSWFDHSGTSHLFGTSFFVPTPHSPIKLTAEFSDSIATHHPFSFGDSFYGFTYTNGQFPDGMRYRGRTLGFSLDTDSTLLSLQGSWSDTAGRFYELSLHHARIGNYHSNSNIVSRSPVIVNIGEARVSLPLAMGGRRIQLDLAGRLQDDQPRPHKGFVAAVEVALRAPF
jgi:Capsule assembly protein Wzi